MTEIQQRIPFSADVWAAWWADPDLATGGDVLADDIVGYWPGDPDPVRGIEPYTAKIAELLRAYPDLRLELIDSATVPGERDGEELVFLHYVDTATAHGEPFTIRGIDRVRSIDGVVVENVVRYDPADLPS